MFCVEGVLQVAADAREVRPAEVRAVRTFVTARVDRAGDTDSFVSRIEEVHGGLDFYVSANALGKALARDLSESFGGTVSSSPKLYGQKQGREVYRVTSLVRLGPFHVGDVVRHKGALAEVTSVRPFVVLRNLATGDSRAMSCARAARRFTSTRRACPSSDSGKSAGTTSTSSPRTSCSRSRTVSRSRRN